MNFKQRILLYSVPYTVLAIAGIFVVVRLNVQRTVAELTYENTRNLMEIAMLSIQNQYNSLSFHSEYAIAARKSERQNIVSGVKSIIEGYYQESETGMLTAAEARKMALKEINYFRYDGGNGYIWINNTDKPVPTMLVHPIFPELSMKPMSDSSYYSTPSGRNLGLVAVEVCEEKGSGFIEYQWPKPDFTGESVSASRDESKISYVELFEPWDWVIGTGVYLDDVKKEARKRMVAIMDELKQTIGNIRIKDTGYFFIFNSNSEMLMHPMLVGDSIDVNLDSINNIIPYQGIIEAEKTEEKAFHYDWFSPLEDIQGRTYRKTVFVEYFEPLDWYVCASFYEKDIEAPGRKLGRNILRISILFLIITIISSLRLAQSIVKPLRELVNYVSGLPQLKHGIDVSKIPDSRLHETSELSRVIKEMLLSIDKQNNSLVQAKMAAEENEKKLSISEKKYRTIYESSNDAIVLINRNKIVDCNRKTLELFKCSKEEILGKMPFELSPEYQEDGSRSEDRNLAIGKEVLDKSSLDFEWKHKRPNGEVFDAMASLKLFDLDGENYIHALLRDITEKKQIARELENHRNNLEKLVKQRTSELEETLKTLKETQARMIQSEKMASLGILTAGVAHEINNPLNYISGAYQGLDTIFEEHQALLGENFRIYLESIRIGIERTSSIVKGLNQFSRDREANNEECELHSIIENCLLMLRNEYKNRIRINKLYHDGELVLMGNVGKLHQVFLNLLINACQAIDTEGQIDIQTSRDQKYIRISISDTGCGISKKNLPKISDPFFTTKEPGEGTGLGLYIVYTIIEEHNGSIHFESEEGKGTNIDIKFPVPKNI